MSRMMWATVFFFLLSFYSCHPVAVKANDPFMPDPGMTPGRAFGVTEVYLCKRGYKSPARDIPTALKCQVFDRYRIGTYEIGYNVDHLIPVRLGGSNSIDNLWPQPLSGEWNWHRKNRLERRLRKLVCRGHLDLKKAQQEIATDWVRAYKKYIGEPEQKW